jgi:predicted DNA-binding transcriptional regulator YafY
MGQAGSLNRILYTLEQLNRGKQVCIGAVSLEFDVSERTVRRDFRLIREYFGDSLRKEGECYRAYEKKLLEQVLGGTDLMTLANIVNLFGMASMDHNISEQTKALLKESMSVYDFKSRPFEVIYNRDIVKKLEHAVRFRKEIELLYRVSRGALSYRYRPYKILFLNENFYLIGENVHKERVEFLRISMIMDVSDGKNTFFHDPNISTFIAEVQTPWAAYGGKAIDVTLLVKQRVSKYFLLKAFLPSQNVRRKHQNGDLEVGYRVHDLREIEELVVKWLPHIRVIEPKALKKRVTSELKRKLRAMEG